MQLLQSFFLSVLLMNLSLGNELQCGSNLRDNHRISVSVNSNRRKGEAWDTSFFAHQNTSSNPRNIELNVTRSYVNCQGNHIIQIGGFLKDMPEGQNNEMLTFKRFSKNAAITNNGRTLQKIKLDGYGSGFTSRTLMDDEVFTVRIDAKGWEFPHGIGIGLSTLTLDNQDLLDNSNNYKTGTWMFYDSSLFHNGTIVNRNYLKTNLKDVEIGQNVGVMRSRSGRIHLYINGVDQGPAASNIPDNVYGVLDLYGNLVKGTIIDA